MTANSALNEHHGSRPGPAAVALLGAQDSTAHDEVTGLLLRRPWTSRAERAPAAAVPTGRPTLLLIDLDGLKLWNDSFGHLPGDRVLAEVVGALRRSLARPVANWAGRA
ncbi:diguanylate cyclase [Pseudonocardia sp. HH130630-07]|uniref:diguanylate cyclase n=1 Tax=Pseudonocardia sp. HH130630-07 TaxID=1690815 RepID=UPI000815304D|nr:diguanylate cyclase [Pseudonocardia sp. HH130630-07]ANY07773.1 hypothetical protein AFB00_17375 [Pseudonocardia sp. HH130630-07]